MTIWQDLLLDPIYASDVAVTATLTRTTGETHSVRAVDLTQGRSAPGLSFADMQSQVPSATVRLSEINAKGITDLKEYFYKGKLTINGRTWRIKSYQPVPAPAGPGEILILLTDEQLP